MIWSKVAIDYSAGFTISKEGTMVPNKTGCYVLTAEEAKEIIDKRCKNGY